MVGFSSCCSTLICHFNVFKHYARTCARCLISHLLVITTSCNTWGQLSLSSTFFMSLFSVNVITKTCLYQIDPLKPHFYIVKLGFTGVYIIFLISAQNIDCGYAVLMSTHNLCFEQKYEKYQSFFIWKFSVFRGEIFYIFEQARLRNVLVLNLCSWSVQNDQTIQSWQNALKYFKVIARWGKRWFLEWALGFSV